jgi:uncharacterized protein YcgI (DUF1989 family)
MKITVTAFQLELIDRVVKEGRHGASRDQVLNAAVLEHAKYLMAGGHAFDSGLPNTLEVDKPRYGNQRQDFVLEPIEGKALPVHQGEVLRISQLVGGQCVDFNAYNLNDYKEYLNCGFNRMEGLHTGKGTLVWSGSPRARPMLVILDCSEPFDQFYEGHRCHATYWEAQYGFDNHPNCQSTFAEAIREYGLTPDDVHTSYNLWMGASLDARGRRHLHWNRARKGDYIELLALFDTLCVPVICGGDLSNVNNLSHAPVQVAIHEPSQDTMKFADLIHERFRYKTQLTPKDFKAKQVRAERKLERDPDYRPDFIPPPKKSTIEVAVTPEALSLLQPLARTGQYGDEEPTMVLACFVRWYNQSRVKDRVSKLTIRS